MGDGTSASPGGRIRPAGAKVRWLTLVTMLLAVACVPYALRAPARHPGWRLVWSDEFDGSGIDHARWHVENRSTFGDGNGELACLMDRRANVNVRTGVLMLTARREPSPTVCGSSDDRFPGGRAYTSGFISTKGKESWRYGRFEVRAQLPTGPRSSRGLWPAFWLRPDHGGPGEFDVFEAIGSAPGDTEWRQVHQTLWGGPSGREKRSTVHVFPAGDPADGFHTYALTWKPSRVAWSVDGVETFHVDRGTTPWLADLDRPFFLRLNLAVGGSWPGPPAATTTMPATMRIDWVRVYQ